MRPRRVILAAAAAAIVAVALTLLLSGDSSDGSPEQAARPGEPAVEVVSPRNGARQQARAVVVKVRVRNFQLAPRHFGGEPQLGEGHLRFKLNRVPNCVDPAKLKKAIESPVGRGRLQGASFDFARYSGPNGLLAERIGSSGSYSPATRPEIYYHELPAGFYRLVISLALNNGATTPYHAVTNFQILPRPGHGPPPCSGGKVSSAKAAAFD
ncbi:MAG TPA: hypothetical protein VHQ43_02385 [Solirubrobacterales bacterium]|jgi:hypothetical protein|nr:hypothetical protein [Solirubrobacterales bacterium]